MDFLTLHSMRKQPKERPAPNNLMVSEYLLYIYINIYIYNSKEYLNWMEEG